MTCVFTSSLRNGKPVQKSTESKAARGTMVRWMAEMGAEGPDDLKRFDMGFRFAPELSNESGPRQTFVFMKRKVKSAKDGAVCADRAYNRNRQLHITGSLQDETAS